MLNLLIDPCKKFAWLQKHSSGLDDGCRKPERVFPRTWSILLPAKCEFHINQPLHRFPVWEEKLVRCSFSLSTGLLVAELILNPGCNRPLCLESALVNWIRGVLLPCWWSCVGAWTHSAFQHPRETTCLYPGLPNMEKGARINFSQTGYVLLLFPSPPGCGINYPSF